MPDDVFTAALVALLPRHRRYAPSLCRRGELADDLVQTAAERAFAARDRFGPQTRLDASMVRILRNAWLDTLRRRRSRGSESDMDDALDIETTHLTSRRRGRGPRRSRRR